MNPDAPFIGAPAFTPLAERWWDEQGPFKILHQINPLRLAWIKQEVCTHCLKDPSHARALDGLSVLDVGSGGGLLTEPLYRMGARVIGCDALPDNVTAAQRHAASLSLDVPYIHSCVEDLPHHLPSASFDVVIALEVIEHTPCVPSFFKALHRMLKPGGLLLVSTLNRTLQSYLLAIVAAERILGWVPQGAHSWEAFLTPEELAVYAARAGFQKKTDQGLVFSPLQGKWRLSPHTNVNYMSSFVLA